jgi:2-methylthioadenine synthetase
MKKGFYIKTFGCQMNEYDSSKINDLLESELNLREVRKADDADLILVNTCSVRDKAQHKLFSELGRWKTLKNKNPKLLIGVGGCVASQEGEDIINKAPFVDLVFGPQTIHKLPQLIKKARFGGAAVDIDFPELEKFDKLPISKNVRSSSYVSIMEGCSKYCSFCVVPYTRGEEFSRPVKDVIKEIHGLVSRGSKEIILLGQNVNAYNAKDDKGRIIDLAALLHLISYIERD